MRLTFLAICLAGMLAVFVPQVEGAAASPQSPQCTVAPSGACGVLVGVQKTGSVTFNVIPNFWYVDKAGHRYVAYGIVNLNSSPLEGVTLSGTNIFAVDGSQPPNGPGVTITNVGANKSTGTVNFSPPLPPGGWTYFNLAAYTSNTTGTAIFAPTTVTPTVSITNIPSLATYGGSFTPSFATNSPGATSVTSSTPSVCMPSGTTVRYVGVGPCSLVAHVAAAPGYAAANGASQGFVVGQASLIITATSGTMTYGGNPPAITAGYSGFTNGDGSGNLSSQPSCSTTATSSSPVASYASTCSGAADPNYSISYVPGLVVVGQASLIITATSGTMTYGGNPPAITAGYSGFTNGDGSGNLSSQPSCSTTATSSSPVASYASTCSGAADPNYSISYVPGLVVVGQAGTSTAVGFSGSTSVGSLATATATVTSAAGAPAFDNGGTVTFTGYGGSLGGSATSPVTLAGCSGLTLSSGTAQCGFTPASAAVYTIIATYSGDTDFQGSSGSGGDSVATTTINCSQNCNGSVNTSNEDVNASSTSTTGTIQLSVNPFSNFSCGDAFRHTPQYTEVTDTNLGHSILFTITFANSAASGSYWTPFAVCYDSPNTTFTDAYGHTTNVGLLPACVFAPSPQSSEGPCVESISELPFGIGNVTEKVLVPAGDPQFH